MTSVVPPPRVPGVVPVLALSIFALGTSEFMIAGLLPEMARDLSATLPQTGYLISAFAVGMIVGAPATAVLTLGLPRRTTLVATLAVFVLGHVAGALSTGYGVMLAARVLTAFATAAFWVVAAVVTVSATDGRLRARALAVLLAGLTVATVLGIPLGTVVGQAWGWRATFWAVAALALAGLVGVLRTVPGRDPAAPRPRLATELGAFRDARLWLALGTTALYQAAALAVFAFVAPLLTEVAGLAAGWVPLVLFGYGLGSLAGITVGGRLADAHPWGVLFTALTVGAALFVALGLFARIAGVAVGLVVLLGFVAFLVAAPLNARVFVLAGDAPTLAGAANTVAFNVGNTLGPAAAGVAVTAGWGWTAPAWIAAALIVASIGTAALGALRGPGSRPARSRPAMRQDPPRADGVRLGPLGAEGAGANGVGDPRRGRAPAGGRALAAADRPARPADP